MNWRSWLTEPTSWERTLAERSFWKRFTTRQRWGYAAFLTAFVWGLGWMTLWLLGAGATATVVLLLLVAGPLSVGVIANAARPGQLADNLRLARVTVVVLLTVSIVGVIATFAAAILLTN